MITLPSTMSRPGSWGITDGVYSDHRRIVDTQTTPERKLQKTLKLKTGKDADEQEDDQKYLQWWRELACSADFLTTKNQ
ncbi:hypothetical protein NDU88_004509 [Pleurodeles waltl]|uniref:Uncharacterized protein n=1 Tax=Pleurodeles waltl TaxID=8319 RepID=A0AAV7RKN6_PLEWA|nr:hypothetical protein NDU88_004509 [Pleurodeles waltl]